MFFPDVYTLEYSPSKHYSFQNRIEVLLEDLCARYYACLCAGGHEVTSGYWGLHVGHGSLSGCMLCCAGGAFQAYWNASPCGVPFLCPLKYLKEANLSHEQLWLLGSRSLPRSGWEGVCWPSWVPAPGEWLTLSAQPAGLWMCVVNLKVLINWSSVTHSMTHEITSHLDGNVRTNCWFFQEFAAFVSKMSCFQFSLCAGEQHIYFALVFRISF